MKKIFAIAGCLIGMVAMAQEVKDSANHMPSKRYMRHRITMVFDEDMRVLDSTCKVDSVYMTPDGKLGFKFSNGKKFSLGPFEMENKAPVKYPEIYSGIHFGIASLMTPERSFSLQGKARDINLNPERSYVWSINPWEQNLFANRRQVNIVTGLGLLIEKYQFENPYLRMSTQNGLLTPTIDSSLAFNRNSFTNTSIEIPLMLRFATKPVSEAKDAFQIAVGISGQWRFRTRQHLEYQRQGVEIEENSWNAFGQNSFFLNAMARIQYKNIGVYAKMGLTPLFKGDANAVAQVVPVSAGLSLGFN